MKITASACPPFSKPINLTPVSVAPKPSVLLLLRGRSHLHGCSKCSILSVSLAFLWLASVLTLTRFCFLELIALKKEISVMMDDSTTSSLDGPWNRGVGALFAVFGESSSTKYDDYDEDDYYDDYYNDDDSQSSEDWDESHTTTVVTTSTSASVLPRLILHVGPSKSATTTLQTDLTAAYDAGWLKSEYAGRFYRPYRAGTNTLMLNRSESPLLVSARKMLHSNYCSRPGPWCCQDFRDELNEYMDLNRTVILSDEAFGNMWTEPEHFRAIQQSLALHWNVTVVVAYRHFYEWILSSKYQRDRTDRISNQGKVQWPGPGPNGGRALLPMFPDTQGHAGPGAILMSWRQWFHYTDTIAYNAKEGSLDIRILDLHAPVTNSSILTQFLCAANLDEDCSTSRRVDLNKSTMTLMNSQANTTVPSLYYDAVATRAAEMKLVNTTIHGRSQVREAIRVFHEDTNGLKPVDLDLQCPTETELAKLLEYSLKMEQAFFVVADQQAHIDGFWSKANSNAFCWVNATAVVNSPKWRDFFAGNFVAKG